MFFKQLIPLGWWNFVGEKQVIILGRPNNILPLVAFHCNKMQSPANYSTAVYPIYILYIYMNFKKFASCQIFINRKINKCLRRAKIYVRRKIHFLIKRQMENEVKKILCDDGWEQKSQQVPLYGGIHSVRIGNGWGYRNQYLGQELFLLGLSWWQVWFPWELFLMLLFHYMWKWTLRVN